MIKPISSLLLSTKPRDPIQSITTIDSGEGRPIIDILVITPLSMLLLEHNHAILLPYCN